MRNEQIFYSSKTYKVIKAFLYGFSIYVCCTGILIFISFKMDTPLIGVIGWILMSTIPFLFQRRFKEFFSVKVDLTFDTLIFSVKEYNLNDKTFIKEESINWSDIESYKCYFTQSNITYIVIYLRNGLTKTFSFSDEKNQEEAIGNKSVFSIFHYFISQYNLGKQKDEMITFKPGFFTTKLGGVVLLSLTSLSVFVIILHFIVDSKTAKFSFMSVFILLGLLVKREGDKKFYNKISQLEPLSPFDNKG